MTKSKFDILYESILTEMGDIHNSILKIYNWDNNKKDVLIRLRMLLIPFKVNNNYYIRKL